MIAHRDIHVVARNVEEEQIETIRNCRALWRNPERRLGVSGKAKPVEIFLRDAHLILTGAEFIRQIRTRASAISVSV